MSQRNSPPSSIVLPPNATLLRARHQAHARDLQRLVDDLPLRTGDRAVALHLQRVWQRVNEQLCSSDRCRLWQLIDPQSKRFLPRRPDFAMTRLDVVTVARVPRGQ